MASRTDTHPYWLGIDQLLLLFPGYKNKQAIYMALHRGTFPIPTFKVGGKIFADREVAKKYFRDLRDEGLATLEASES